MSKTYALLKNNVVVNIVLFDDNASPELMQTITEANDATDYVSCTEYGNTSIGGSFDGKKLWFPQPFPSWVKDEQSGTWQAPIPYPDHDKNYYWDETVVGWIEDS